MSKVTRQPRYHWRNSGRSVALRPVLSNGLPYHRAWPGCRQTPPKPRNLPPNVDAGLTTMADEPRHLSELLNAGPLARVLRESERRRMETARVRSLLPAEEARACRQRCDERSGRARARDGHAELGRARALLPQRAAERRRSRSESCRAAAMNDAASASGSSRAGTKPASDARRRRRRRLRRAPARRATRAAAGC